MFAPFTTVPSDSRAAAIGAACPWSGFVQVYAYIPLPMARTVSPVGDAGAVRSSISVPYGAVDDCAAASVACAVSGYVPSGRSAVNVAVPVPGHGCR